MFCKFSKLAAAAFAAAHDVDGCHDFIYSALVGVFLLGLLVLLVGVSTVLDGDSAVLVGALFLFNFYLCLPGGRSPKEEKSLLWIHFLHISCQVDSSPDYDQGSGKHGIVSSLPVGLGQASGRVDVPDDAKIEAAAAFGGTLRSGPGSLDALQNSVFLKGHDGCTRVINCHDGDLIHDVVGYVGWDIYATLHGQILDLSGTLQSQGVSDNDTIRIFCRLRGGSNNADIPDSGSVPFVMLRGVGQCFVTAAGVEHPGQILLLLLLLGMLVALEGVAKALWVEILLLVLVMCRPQPGNRVSCLLVVHQVLGSELLQGIPILLCYLESCLARSSFFRQSCLQRTSPSMRSWWLLLLKKKGPRNVSIALGKSAIPKQFAKARGWSR